MTGVVDGTRNDTSTAGAGSLSLEFSILSRLIGDPVYERVARRAVHSLWNKRNNVTGLLGLLNIERKNERTIYRFFLQEV